MPKRSIRQNLLQQRRSLDAEAIIRLSRSIQQNLLARAEYRQAAVIGLYAPIHNEVRTADLFGAALRHKKKVCFPKVVGHSLEFLEVNGDDDLVSGAFGVAEPKDGRKVRIEDIDLLVVPGVAFDRCGFRLGYGQGYYDRAISSSGRAFLAGLAFEFQIVDELPTEEHDVQLDLLITGSEVLAFNT